MPQISFIQAINQAIAEEMERDPLTFLMGEDVVLGAFGATRGLIDKFGAKRVRNTPISEAGFVGAAVGAAMAGTRPICEVEFASFFYCAFDQICNQAAKLRYMSGGQATMPITFRAVYGAMGGAAAQHSETVYAQFLSVPGLKLVVPSGASDMKGLLKSAIRDGNPIVFIEGEVIKFDSVVAGGEKTAPEPVSHRKVHFTSADEPVDTPVYDAEALRHTHVIAGPAIVTTENTTYLVEPGWRLEPTVQGAVWLLSD